MKILWSKSCVLCIFTATLMVNLFVTMSVNDACCMWNYFFELNYAIWMKRAFVEL